MSIHGAVYFITFTEHLSRFKFTYLLKHKSDAVCKFKDLKVWFENKTGARIKTVHSDNASEFQNGEFGQFLRENGIRFESNVPYCSEQNGISERGHRTLMDSARSMVNEAKLPSKFMGSAVLVATHLHSNSPHPTQHNTTQHQILKGTKPQYDYLRVFGCICSYTSPKAHEGGV